MVAVLGDGAELPLVEGGAPGYGSLAEILIDTRGAAAAGRCRG